jgi:hypothetical protein
MQLDMHQCKQLLHRRQNFERILNSKITKSSSILGNFSRQVKWQAALALIFDRQKFLKNKDLRLAKICHFPSI